VYKRAAILGIIALVLNIFSIALTSSDDPTGSDDEDVVMLFFRQHPVAGSVAAIACGAIMFLIAWHMHWDQIEKQSVFGDLICLSTYVACAIHSCCAAAVFAVQCIAFGHYDPGIMDVALFAGLIGFPGLFFDLRRVAVPRTRLSPIAGSA
jgi:hypothetical protein